MPLILALVLAPLFIYGADAQLAQADKDAILNYHNNLRSEIAQGHYEARGNWFGPTADMRKLKWDNALATQAQNWANRCKFEHSSFNNTGENIYKVSSSATLPIAGQGLEACKDWASEFEDIDWPQMPSFDLSAANSGIGHATQMAWAKTTKIGCGAARCDSNKSVLVVCQYQGQGNILNTDAFASGSFTCGSCGATCEVSTGLCL
ncbi:unnamed protein product, partial [Mesorhabditis spiculigera]